MKPLSFILLALFISISFTSTGQVPNNCNQYSTIGTEDMTNGNYYATFGTDTSCWQTIGGLVDGWSQAFEMAYTGTSCSGTLVSTVNGPAVSCLTLSYTSVNNDDFATISIDGGGNFTITGVNVGVNGNQIGPYQCGSSNWGTVSITICSDQPFTTVTLTNTGCSSGWVVNCADQTACGGSGTAGSDNLGISACSGTIDLDSFMNGSAGGAWVETTSSGQFNSSTAEFNVNGLSAGTYEFYYFVTGGCSGSDTAFFEVSVGNGGSNAGLDVSSSLCDGSTFVDLDTILVGADPGGNWTEISNSGAFNAGNGILDVASALPGTYTFQYLTAAVPPCVPDTAFIEITILPSPDTQFEFEVNGVSSTQGGTGGCLSYPLELFDFSTIQSGNITNWSWSFGDGNTSNSQNPTHIYGSQGNYNLILTVTADNGCSAALLKPIFMSDGANMSVSNNDPTCFGFSDGSITLNSTSASPTFLITDSLLNQMNSTSSNTANTLGEGWYYLTVDDGSGCVAFDSVFLDAPNQIQFDVSVVNPTCFNSLDGFAYAHDFLHVNGSSDQLTFIWNPDLNAQSGIGNDSLMNVGGGQYSLSITDLSGCSSQADFLIEAPSEMTFSQLGSEAAYCRSFGYQNGNGVVFAAASGGTPDYDYLWTNLSTLQTSTNSTWGGLNPGTYQILCVDDNNCQITETVYVDSLNPMAEFNIMSDVLNYNGTIYEGTAPVDLSLENVSQYFAIPNNNDDTTFFWNFDSPEGDWVLSSSIYDTYDLTFNEGVETEICLIAINKNGCEDTSCVKILIHDQPMIVLPNVFTPNGDGSNDFFEFNFHAGVDNFNCSIYDRWGKTVFEFSDISDKWNGNNKNDNQCSSGVYFYTYEVNFTNGTKQNGQGNIHLLR